ncbi:ribosomal-protein-alanine N-acetyltransferase [Thermoanaerobacterium sp. PSU-2]|jgi:ribosomal-protein-alanine N-acetyltransferase|uniref:ribosomal protein S18-alanine N-acetyltransferase n=1 Tax=Thermoanaerobacterium sp. PSU-2 TaxID=1930849 RepID=UPI000A147926|nr:ribosomal protein S18-alanine N-acetyltransferase [Thermoanaerobacterium sp. PSU-2]ORX24493.1 ribosomal-protein-alanine N-acetyltransferase [Thermoanaerobacterium sp. PSU-2]HHV74838.1 ribosomal protein S18-alanine N-acetyltransferase [Thermoanaerobacterium sp.]
MDIKIRPMVKSDIDKVMEIEYLSFSVPWSFESFVMEVTKNSCAHYIVAEVDGKVAGYGGFWVVVDEGHITNIAVHPDFRGKGVGSAIVEGLIELAKNKGITSMTLEVRESNLVAQSLYKKYGFRPVGKRRGYYQDNNEDAVIMWKYDM